ncbi:hypothetical protein BpHYR1_051597 [Brachionus plicatilis]|uniref:Uncharacterized protein n=1 Tax=Brachionus plicatilis TaxID=10195 RepID=A0A3M7R380_BRAPC|nr:hypothetical protein BpHYR1_051597 [Brachionus plicatilis]
MLETKIRLIKLRIVAIVQTIDLLNYSIPFRLSKKSQKYDNYISKNSHFQSSDLHLTCDFWCCKLQIQIELKFLNKSMINLNLIDALYFVFFTSENFFGKNGAKNYNLASLIFLSKNTPDSYLCSVSSTFFQTKICTNKET